MSMRFATRTFLWSFVPFAILLLGSFWTTQKLVELAVRSELRASLRRTQQSIASMRSNSELQNSRFLKILGEDAALKAGLQLLLAAGRAARARGLTLKLSGARALLLEAATSLGLGSALTEVVELTA